MCSQPAVEGRSSYGSELGDGMPITRAIEASERALAKIGHGIWEITLPHVTASAFLAEQGLDALVRHVSVPCSRGPLVVHCDTGLRWVCPVSGESCERECGIAYGPRQWPSHSRLHECKRMLDTPDLKET